MSHSRHLLVIDTAYTFQMMAERGLAALVTSRDLGGYFSHVWTVHPFASLLLPENSPDRFGPPQVHRLAERHTVIEGKLGRFQALAKFPKLNFALSQIGLIGLLLGLIVRQRIRCIRAEDPLYNGAFALLLARLTRLPAIIGVWATMGRHRKRVGQSTMPRLFRSVEQEEKVERFVLKHADRVLVGNVDNRTYVLEQGASPERTAIFRVGNAIDPSHFQPLSQRPSGQSDLEELKIHSLDRVLICVARLEPVKKVDDAIKATAVLKQKGLRIKTLLAGDGSQREELARMAREWGVEEEVLFLGNRNQEWLLRVMPLCSAILSPATGRALVEACLSGTPIVAYDLEWQGEMIEHTVTGELVPFLDYQAMADSVERFLEDPDYARAMGLAGRTRALEMMDQEQLLQTQIQLFADLGI